MQILIIYSGILLEVVQDLEDIGEDLEAHVILELPSIILGLVLGLLDLVAVRLFLPLE